MWDEGWSLNTKNHYILTLQSPHPSSRVYQQNIRILGQRDNKKNKVKYTLSKKWLTTCMSNMVGGQWIGNLPPLDISRPVSFTNVQLQWQNSFTHHLKMEVRKQCLLKTKLTITTNINPNHKAWLPFFFYIFGLIKLHRRYIYIYNSPKECCGSMDTPTFTLEVSCLPSRLFQFVFAHITFLCTQLP